MRQHSTRQNRNAMFENQFLPGLLFLFSTLSLPSKSLHFASVMGCVGVFEPEYPKGQDSPGERGKLRNNKVSLLTSERSRSCNCMGMEDAWVLSPIFLKSGLKLYGANLRFAKQLPCLFVFMHCLVAVSYPSNCSHFFMWWWMWM